MSQIVVASGSLAVRMDLDETLATNGFLFITVSTCDQARTILDAGGASMLILDPVMRDGDGMRLLTEIRENPRYSSLPILLLCSEVDSERFGDSDIGWDQCEFLGKPYDKDHVIERAAQYATRLDVHTGQPLKPSVLAIDADDDYSTHLKSALGDSGFNVSVCRTRDEAKALLQVSRFDAVLIDLTLISRSSGNLRRWIRQAGQLATTALIVLTRKDDRDSMIAVFSSGADDYVVKSNNFEGLTGRLRAQMRRKQAENENRRMRETLLIKAMQTTEAERARRNAEARAALLAELETKNRELETAKQAAEAGAAAKSAFLASMSHEIRTPMNAILGMADIMDAEETDAEKRQRLDIIRSSGSHLLTLIDQVLDFSKIEAGKMEIHDAPVEIRACVEDALEIVAFQASQKSLDLAYEIAPDVPTGILSDIGRIRQILINFLGNAVKFTHEGEVSVRVSLAKTSDTGGNSQTQIQFSVSDTGIGIPKHQLKDLFVSFNQLDHSSKRRYGGTGLGLAISQRLSELLGGKCWCESEPGQGSTFHFVISGQPISIPLVPAESDGTLLQGMNVLIVDDNETARGVMSAHIRNWGGKARCATDSREALAMIDQDTDFHAALIDYRLGSENGLELGARIRANHGPDLPLLLVSSISNSMKVDSNFAAFVAKPIRQVHLYDILKRCIRKPHRASLTAESDRGDTPVINTDPSVLKDATVLLVEDNALNRQVAQLMLNGMGVKVAAVGSGSEAIQICQSKHFDVILMDLNMPEMDGLEATDAILTSWPADADPPRIVALTAAALNEERERCINAGMIDFVTKPVSSKGLENALCRALSTPVERLASTG